MNPNVFLKLLLLLLLPTNFGLIFSMEEQNQSSSEEESSENEGLKTPENLTELAGIQIAKKAAEIYDEKGYAAFEEYLKKLPEHIKIDEVFCKLINYLDRADIFISKLKEIYKESRENAVKYFSKFCKEGAQTILAELFEERVLDKELIRYLINNITDIDMLDFLFSYLPGVTGKKKPRLSKKARSRLRAFKVELTIALKIKIEHVLKEIGEKQVHVEFSDEILRIAPELINLALENLINFTERFNKLEREIQQEFFRYLFLEYAVQGFEKSDNAFLIFNSIFPIWQVDSFDKEAIKRIIKTTFEILYKFDEMYPTVKKLNFSSFTQENVYTKIYGNLIQEVNVFVTHFLMRLLRESKTDAALNLLNYVRIAFAKMKEVESEYDENDSITLNFLDWLTFPPQLIPQEQDDVMLNYFKNLYELFKKSIPNIKCEFQEFTSNIEEPEFAIDNWLSRLKTWFNVYYINELKNRNLITIEEIKSLREDFKKEVLEKFESSN